MTKEVRPFPLLILLATLMLASTVNGAYNVSAQVRTSPGELLTLSRHGGATFVRDDVLYTVGGFRQGYTFMIGEMWAYSINERDGTVNATSTSAPVQPITYAQAVLLPDNDRVLLFGGNASTGEGQNGTLKLQEYRFSTDQWQDLPVNSSTAVPQNRYKFTATLASNGKIYIFGGLVPPNLVPLQDLWEYDPATSQFTAIPIDYVPKPTWSLTAVAMPDGRIVHVAEDPSSSSTQWNAAFVFDTHSRTGTGQPLSNHTTYPVAKHGANALLAADNSTIYYFGGSIQTGDPTMAEYNQAYNDFNVLDTTTWTWITPASIHGTPPKPRRDASAGLLLRKYWVILGGISEFYWTNDLNVLALPSLDSSSAAATGSFAWLTNITDPLLDTSPSEPQNNSRRISPGGIAGIVVGSVLFLALASTLFWMIWNGNGSLALRLTIWHRRVGEPWWTAFMHSASRLILMAVFILYLVYTIRQVINSPQTHMTFSKPVAEVRVPDIRFCFNDWGDEDVLYFDTDTVPRSTTGGWNFTHHLDMTQHMPYYSTIYHGAVKCWLFIASPEFKLAYQAQTDSNNGTRLKFLFGGAYPGRMNNTRVQISVYPPDRDPNRVVYNIANDPPAALSYEEIQRWTDLELSDQQTENTYTAEINTYSSIAYQLKDHRYLLDVGWNRVGFSSIYNRTPEIDTSFRMSIQNEQMMVKNTVDVYPASFVEVTEEEQRIHTVVQSIGSVGGLLSLFVFLDSFLYGSRPPSMFGVVQRLSFGRARRSIRQNLLKGFGFLGRPVPFAQPINDHLLDARQLEQHTMFRTQQRANNNTHAKDELLEDGREMQQQPLQQQVAELTRRLQLMELVLKGYYIDDEVFSNLHAAHRVDIRGNNNSNGFSPFSRRPRRQALGNPEDDEEQSREASDNFLLRSKAT